MSDIDDEFMALVGEASDEEEEAPANDNKAASLSPDGATGKPSAKKSKKARRQDESEEEGEA